MRLKLFILTLILVSGLWMPISPPEDVAACGGLFCQNTPVAQQAENIVFTVNDNDTLTAIVQINYTGAPENFSWVVPVPSIPEVDVAQMELFVQLEAVTDSVIIPPDKPNCPLMLTPTPSPSPTQAPTPTTNPDSVEVLASGEAGPYEYDVITATDYRAMISWLNINSYQITPPMEPLIKVYSDEGMVFLAMKLQPDFGVQDIAPVKMTYESERPMIPLRLTAVAANANMNIKTWIFAESQAYPVNYAYPTIRDSDIRLDYFRETDNYLALVDRTIDLYQGRALVTEYAQPSALFLFQSTVTSPELREIAENYPYVTRFFGRISPAEMTVDPLFDFDAMLPDVSNIHDLRQFDAETVWSCNNTPINIEFEANIVPANWQ